MRLMLIDSDGDVLDWSFNSTSSCIFSGCLEEYLASKICLFLFRAVWCALMELLTRN
jgi:hypothetical protein